MSYKSVNIKVTQETELHHKLVKHCLDAKVMALGLFWTGREFSMTSLEQLISQLFCFT